MNPRSNIGTDTHGPRQHAPHADGFGNLYSVACVTASDCTAVGQSYGASDGAQLALHWNGSAWSIRNTAAVPDGRLSNLKGVSCITSSNCWTVGYSETDGDPTGPDIRRLAEHWNGKSWSNAVTPAPGSPTEFGAISCSQGQCIAVGTQGPGATQQIFADRSNGTQWTYQPVTTPSPTDLNVYGVDCVSATTCIAVGQYGFKTLVERTG